MRDLYESYLSIYGVELDEEFIEDRNYIRKIQREDKDLILNYLVEKCYASNYNSASYILESMSDNWMINILEVYYSPNQKLPKSNKTPLQKAIEKSRARAKTIAHQSRDNQDRWGRHYDKIQTHVKHGADNPNVNSNLSHFDKDNIKIDKDNDGMSLHHKKSGVSFHVYRPSDSDDAYTIEWNHNKDTSKMSRPEKINLAKSAKHVWDKHVSHRLPNSTIVHNTPTSDRRASIYSRVGFGNTDDDNNQFARTERKKGKTRLRPVNPEKAKWDSNWNSIRDHYDDL